MYSHRLIEAFENVKYQSDVTIYCQNKTQVKTNKLSLFFSSKLFAKLIGNSENYQFLEYDVICPDFDPSSMSKVIELINTGSTKVSMASEAVYKGMIDIMQCLQIKIQLNKKTFSNCPTKKPPPFEVAVLLYWNLIRYPGDPVLAQVINLDLLLCMGLRDSI